MTYRSPDQDWKDLVVRFADGRTVCNCGSAYYTNCGKASIWDAATNDYKRVEDHPACAHGCSSNQISCKQEIATKVIALLDKP